MITRTIFCLTTCDTARHKPFLGHIYPIPTPLANVHLMELNNITHLFYSGILTLDILSTRYHLILNPQTEVLIRMLYLSEILIQNPDLESFDELLSAVKERSKSEMFFRIDVKPQYFDTPEDWEDRLEAAFT